MLKEKFPGALLALVVVAVLGVASLAYAQPGKGNLTVYIDVFENGNASVKIVVSPGDKGFVQLALPRFEKVYACGGSASEYRVVNSTSGAYFYFNSTIYFAEKGSSLALCYNFPYAVLMSGSRGWFMSPLLWSSEPEVVVYVKLPLVKRITYESPSSVGVSGNYRVYVLSPLVEQYIGNRVVVEYDLQSSTPVDTILYSSGGSTITVKFPVYYRSIALKVRDVAASAIAELSLIAGLRPSNVTFVFYLPERSMGGISALGFVMGEDVNAGGKGPVNLNLALIRYAPGYLETTVIHELVHVYLGAAGVEANDNTRWFHEGMAQYVSILVAKKLGVNISEYESELNESAASYYNYTGGKIGFIESWPSDAVKEGEAYLASYYVVHTLATKYGGENFVKRVFATLQGRHITTTREIVNVLSQAAGTNLAPLFREWGFRDVEDWTPSNAKTPPSNSTSTPSSSSTGNSRFLIAMIALLAVIFIVTYVVNAVVERELRIAEHAPV